MAEELIGNPTKLTRNKSGKWRSLTSALETVWKSSSLDGLAQRLDAYRRELNLRLLLLLNSKNDVQQLQQAEAFERIEKRSQDIVEVVSVGLEIARKQHHETITAILTLRDGVTQTLSRQQIGRNDGDDVHRTATKFREGDSHIQFHNFANTARK